MAKINYKNTNKMFNLLAKLFPINRSITGEGVRETLSILKKYLPQLKIYGVPSGKKVFDWQVPLEWNIKNATLTDPNGNKIIDFKDSNLHVVGYSIPVDRYISFEELQSHLYSLPKQPSAIPYVTSYYKETWGFCLAEDIRKKMKKGIYHVKIDSTLEKGMLNYGELIISGESKKEVFISTYICHPSLANNELSGPVVATYLAKWIQNLKSRKYTYRFVFIPETIGSIVYLSKNLGYLKKNVIAGFNINCIGDEREYSYLQSRNGNTLSDRVAQHVLKNIDPNYKSYDWLHRGSDERQYCAPGVDLPIASIMRSKFATYPEYHTSLDNLDLVSEKGLEGGLNAFKKCIEAIEKNYYPKIKVLCEPQLGRRGLYPSTSTKSSSDQVSKLMDFISYSDGQNDLISIANKLNCPIWEIYPFIDKLRKEKLL